VQDQDVFDLAQRKCYAIVGYAPVFKSSDMSTLLFGPTSSYDEISEIIDYMVASFCFHIILG